MPATCLLACVSGLALAAQASPPRDGGASRQAQPSDQRGRAARGPDEVVVTGARAKVVASADRTSFSVANDLQVQNGTLADALRAVPGVEVDLEGKVSLRGDPGVTILIDGRPSALLRGDTRGDALSSMPAGQIDRVEVITNPSAAMSPEGSGGVINLVTKRVRPDARFATVRANIGTRGRGALSVNGSHSGKRLTLTGDFALRRFTGEQEATLDRVRLDRATGAAVATRQRSTLETKMAMGSARVGAEYAIDPKSRLTGELTYRTGLQDIDRADVSVSDVPAGSFERDADMNMKLHNVGGRTSWQRTLPGRGHELTVDLNVEQLRQRRFIGGVTSFTAASSSIERISNMVERTEIDAKVDYKRPIGETGTLNLGYEGDFSDSDFDFRGVRGATFNLLAPVPALTNRFGFIQAVHAWYGTSQFDIGKFEAQIGLRAEQVELNLDQRTDGISIDRDDFRLYPTAHLNYELNASEQLRASYSRRIQRPSAQDLNPYTIYVDPLNLRRGNPFLRPAVTDSFEAAWQRRKGANFYSITGFYRTARGGITDVVQDLGNNVFLNTRANLATAERVGGEVVANGRVTKRLTYNASGSLLWNEIDPRQGGFSAKRSGTTGTVRASISWQANEKDLFQLSGNYSGRQLIAQGYREPGGILNLGYQHKFDQRYSLTLTGQNVLDSARQVTVIDTPLLRDRIRQTGLGAIVMLGLTINLGSQTGRRRPEPAFDFDQGTGSVGG